MSNDNKFEQTVLKFINPSEIKNSIINDSSNIKLKNEPSNIKLKLKNEPSNIETQKNIKNNSDSSNDSDSSSDSDSSNDSGNSNDFSNIEHISNMLNNEINKNKKNKKIKENPYLTKLNGEIKEFYDSINEKRDVKIKYQFINLK